MDLALNTRTSLPPTTGVTASSTSTTTTEGAPVDLTLGSQLPKRRIGVIVSGQAELADAVLALLAIDEAGAEAVVVAPSEALIDAARIGRPVEDAKAISGTDLDAWLVPGGSRALSDVAHRGAQAMVQREVSRVLREAMAARIPVGASGTGPVVLGACARLSSTRLKLSAIDEDDRRLLEGMGHRTQPCALGEVVIDVDRAVVTSPPRSDSSFITAKRSLERVVGELIALV